MKISLLPLRILSVLVFIVITSNPVFAANMYPGVGILVGVVSEGKGMETKMDTLIYNLLVFELERYGLITEKTQFETNDSFELILSSELEPSLALICSYTTMSKRVLLDIELYDTRTMVVLASNSLTADLDLSFDASIHTAVSELMNTADGELSKRVVNLDFKGTSTDVEEDTTDTGGITEPELSLSDSVVNGGLEVFLNAGVTMGVGDSHDALQDPGVVTEISLNYWFFSAFGFFGIGVQSSANLYSVSAQTDKSILLLFPLGITAGYSSPTDRLFSIMFQFGSGPAIASLIYEGVDPLVKVIPYASTNISLSFNFHKKMSLGLKTAYNIYFEEASLLTTLSSVLYVSFRSWN